jgi:hypothetical protein
LHITQNLLGAKEIAAVQGGSLFAPQDVYLPDLESWNLRSVEKRTDQKEGKNGVQNEIWIIIVFSSVLKISIMNY